MNTYEIGGIGMPQRRVYASKPSVALKQYTDWVKLRKGETLTFKITNLGPHKHEMQVTDEIAEQDYWGKLTGRTIFYSDCECGRTQREVT